jgi:hypothetical protein
MRRLIGLIAAVVLIAGCGGSPTTDPYELVSKATNASYDLVQVNVGVSGQSSGSTIAIDPSAIQVVIDGKGGKSAFKLALPVSALGADAAGLAQLGVTGDTIDVQIVFDGEGLYANGPIVSSVLKLLLAQAGQTPGDLSGWLRLGTKEEFAATAQQLGPGAVPSMAPLASHDAASIKKALNDAGIVLTYAGSASRSGKDADHVTATVDVSKLRSSEAFNSLTGTQLQQIESAFDQMDVSFELWIERGSSRFSELDVHATAKDGSGDKADLTILISQPSDASALTAPTDYQEVPLAPIIQTLLQSFGQGLFTQ